LGHQGEIYEFGGTEVPFDFTALLSMELVATQARLSGQQAHLAAHAVAPRERERIAIGVLRRCGEKEMRLGI
jgi:hypothetical protein